MGHDFVQGWTRINLIGDHSVHDGLELDKSVSETDGAILCFEGFPKLRWACHIIELVSNGVMEA